MKKYIWLFGLPVTTVSCDKIKQTTDTVKQADSIMTTVSKGYKSLDSISTVLTDSAKTNSVLRKQKEIIDKNINLKNLNVKNLDSVASALKKISATANSAEDMSKTIDSVQNELKNTDDPLKSISIISKTIDKALKKNSAKAQRQIQDSTIIQPSDTGNAIVKNGNFEVEVSDYEGAKIQLENIFRNNSATVISKSESNNNSSAQEQTATVKIPAKNYDNAVAEIENLGQVSLKTMNAEGSSYNPEQLYYMTVMLYGHNAVVSNPAYNNTNTPTITPNVNPYNYPAESSFGKYITAVIVIVMVILVSLLIFLISANRKRKKKSIELQTQKLKQEAERLRQEKLAAEKKIQEITAKQQLPNSPNDDPDDYSRFMPK